MSGESIAQRGKMKLPRYLSVNGFARLEGDFQVQSFELDCLGCQTFEVHFNLTSDGIKEGVMCEIIEIKVTIKAIVQMLQHVEIKSSRNALGIIISGFEDIDRFLEVNP